ncbi:alpha/beta hydrolase family esterase [Allonocardiopsis opalescens]|uniref:Polyhydroxybutyrate depolymerase n=1 Tax=Allonocardiopsis opalescens TaxID=1144618 RepID=A0A2T0PYP7_9ACTN|nr:poly(3-hydroxybutyrate) depolymerase [Allonocardiopsis opalescens]PRX96654.1 polyhydroxybutyrate depolymerase [Allonocardiopsis opalescens]
MTARKPGTALRRAPRATALLATALAALALLGGTPAPAAADRGPVAGSDGCGSAAPHRPGTSATYRTTSGGIERTYQLHLPEGYQPRRPWPVVLAYHGRGSTGTELQGFSGLSALPAVLVYPEGVVGTGEGERQAWQGAPYSAPGVDDVAFTEDLIDRLADRLCLDERRIYATGKSNGGGFTALLACRAADRIAAIAPVAGAFYPTGEECRPSRPVPVIEFHGTADATIPYTGDADRGLPAVPEWTAAWAGRDGCRPRPSVRRIEPDIELSRWSGCAAGTAVAHVAIDGGGHTWPGADAYSGGGHTTQTIEAHQVLWRFVARHRLPVR